MYEVKTEMSASETVVNSICSLSKGFVLLCLTVDAADSCHLQVYPIRMKVASVKFHYYKDFLILSNGCLTVIWWRLNMKCKGIS